MKNNIEYQNRLPGNDASHMIAEHDSAYVAAGTGMTSVRRVIRRHRNHSNWLLWVALAFLAVAVFAVSVFWYSGYGRHIGYEATMHGSNKVGNVVLTEEYAAFIPATTASRQNAAESVSAASTGEEQRKDVPTTISDVVYLFPLNSSSIPDNDTLNRLARQVAASGDNVIIVAYTDKDGNSAYNQRLSEKRARSVGDYLISHGVKPSQIRTIGKGENASHDNPALDRRAEIHITRS